MAKMSHSDMLATIKSLASSQGYYGRLYNQLTTDPECAEAFYDAADRANIQDQVDLVLFIEN